MTVPDRLVGTERFIKLEKESKAPKFGPDGPFYKADSQELTQWIEDGGNVGINLGDLVALDVDSYEFGNMATEFLPETFTVRSGGGGEHRYYRCGWSGCLTFREDGDEVGSVRSGNWYLVLPPSVHDETGERYHVLRNSPITPVPKLAIQDFLQEASDRWKNTTANTPGRGGGGSAGGTSVPTIPERYPNKDVDRKTVNQWLDSNGFLTKLKYTAKDRSAQEFLIAKCLAEGGFSKHTISDTLDRLPRAAKWHERDSPTDDYQKRTVHRAIVAACNDDFVTFDSTDDSGDRGVPDEGKPQGESRMSEGATFEEKESVVELNDDGGAVQARLMQGTTEDGERFEYVDVATGEVEEMETVDGDSVQVPNINDGPGETDSLGSPETLESKIDALQQLLEEIEN